MNFIRISLIVMAVIKLTCSHAQFYIGSQGITIKSNTVFTYENLSLMPNADFILNSNSLQKSTQAIGGNPNGSINKVYRFTEAVTFSGTVTISYLKGELNGNSENDLQIAYAQNENQEITVTSGSNRNPILGQISNYISTSNLMLLSAAAARNALPVKLANFSVNAEGQSAVLSWSTSSEVNADRFEIERSRNGKTWVTLGMVEASAEDGNLHEYTFIDKEVDEGINYYRLKMIDSDQTYAWSSVKSVSFITASRSVIFPNPASDYLEFRNNRNDGPMLVSIVDLTGRCHKEQVIRSGEKLIIKSLVAGMYVIQISQGGQQYSRTFVKR